MTTAKFWLHRPEDSVEASVRITMTLAEWRKLKDVLWYGQAHWDAPIPEPAIKFLSTVNAILAEAEQVFSIEKIDDDQT